MKLLGKGLLLISVPTVCEIAMLALLLQGQNQAAEAERWAAHSKDVIAQINAIQVPMLVASGEFRGSLLAGNPALPDEALWAGIDARLTHLTELVADNPPQIERTRELRDEVEAYRAAMKRVLDLAKTEGIAATARFYGPDQREGSLRRFEDKSRAFLDVEERLEMQRVAAAASARSRQRTLLIAVVIASALAAALGAFVFTRGIGVRLQQLTVNAGRLAQRQPLLPTDAGDDEIGELDQALRQTAARLDSAEAERERYKEDLEGRNLELRAANEDLRKKTEENELFVYSVSHDLRSPLVNLQGFARELRYSHEELGAIIARAELPERERTAIDTLVSGDIGEALRYVDTAVLRAAAIIDALLRLSRAGRVEYNLAPVDVNVIVRRVVDALHASITAKGASVVLHELPPAYADAVALEQVFGNLLANAVAYLDPNRPGHIEVGVLPGSDATGLVTYKVTDNGLGIAEAYLSKVFTAFQRLHANVAPGEGVGLALVQRVVERHGGRVWVESVSGVGTTFFVGLPQPPPQT